VLFTQTTADFSRQLGQQLRAAREAAGMGVDAVSARLKMHSAIIRALETGDWERLGAPIFVRGQLRSYGQLLGVDLTGLDEVVHAQPQEPIDQAPQVPLLPQARPNRLRQALALAATLAVIAALWWILHWWRAPERDTAAPADTPAASAPETGPGTNAEPPPEPPATATGAAQEQAQPAPPTAAAATPAAAAPTIPAAAPPAPATSVDADESVLTLRLSADSWVELYAPNGRVIEQKLLRAGDVRRFRRGQLGRVAIGNADGVEVLRGGVVQDVSAFKRANVVRFAVSSDGAIARAPN